MTSDVVAKNLFVLKLEDIILVPMFTLFRVQHDQIASRTETNNSLLYHFKSSMANVRHWNSVTVRDFCKNLVVQFPQLGDTFQTLFSELQQITCKILNKTSESTLYEIVSTEPCSFLHSLMSACSDAFISHPQWFAVEEGSTEYQTCLNKAKLCMQEAKVVEKTIMDYIKVETKQNTSKHNKECCGASDDFNFDIDYNENNDNSNSNKNNEKEYNIGKKNENEICKIDIDSNSDDDKCVKTVKPCVRSNDGHEITREQRDKNHQNSVSEESDDTRYLGNKLIDIDTGSVNDVSRSSKKYSRTKFQQQPSETLRPPSPTPPPLQPSPQFTPPQTTPRPQTTSKPAASVTNPFQGQLSHRRRDKSDKSDKSETRSEFETESETISYMDESDSVFTSVSTSDMDSNFSEDFTSHSSSHPSSDSSSDSSSDTTSNASSDASSEIDFSSNSNSNCNLNLDLEYDSTSFYVSSSSSEDCYDQKMKMVENKRTKKTKKKENKMKKKMYKRTIDDDSDDLEQNVGDDDGDDDNGDDVIDKFSIVSPSSSSSSSSSPSSPSSSSSSLPSTLSSILS